MSRQLISYLRVSSAQQGRSGLGIESQREAISRFALAEGFVIVGEYVEVETGKGSDALDRRPKLASALKDARKRRTPVAVAKLDRLSRDVHFIRNAPRRLASASRFAESINYINSGTVLHSVRRPAQAC